MVSKCGSFLIKSVNLKACTIKNAEVGSMRLPWLKGLHYGRQVGSRALLMSALFCLKLFSVFRISLGCIFLV